MNTKRIMIFLAFAFGIPWGSALVISQSDMMANIPARAGELANYIFIATPWLANIATRLISREGWGNLSLRPNFKKSWRFYVAAWWLPILATLIGGAVFFLIYPESFDPNLGVVRKMAENSPAYATISPWMILLSTTLSLMFISVPINSVVSIGEEFGWRAYLLPKLMLRFAGGGFIESGTDGDLAQVSINKTTGARKAALITGLVHGVWHLPLLLMTTSLDSPATFLTPLVYLIFTCSLSILLSWVTLRSGSVWPASVGHGAVNATSILPGFLLKGSAIPLIGPDVTGLIGGIGFTCLALMLFFNRRAFSRGKKAAPEQVTP